MHASTWHIDSTSILSRRELAAVLADAKAKATKSANAWRNLIVFRLACCCGLRVSEIAQLEMGDVTLTSHHGRHTFISHALAGGRSLAEVRAAAGHSNVAITSVYLHVVVDETDGVGDLFGANHSPIVRPI
jgi:integrase